MNASADALPGSGATLPEGATAGGKVQHGAGHHRRVKVYGTTRGRERSGGLVGDGGLCASSGGFGQTSGRPGLFGLRSVRRGGRFGATTDRRGVAAHPGRRGLSVVARPYFAAAARSG